MLLHMVNSVKREPPIQCNIANDEYNEGGSVQEKIHDCSVRFSDRVTSETIRFTVFSMRSSVKRPPRTYS